MTMMTFEQWVSRNIRMNLTGVVGEILEATDDLESALGATTGYAPPARDDYIAAAERHPDMRFEKDPDGHPLGWYLIDGDGHMRGPEPEKWICALDWADSVGEDIDDRPIMQQWLVDRDFGRWLADRSEAVVFGAMGFEAIWGRTTAGAALRDDEIIQEAFQEYARSQTRDAPVCQECGSLDVKADAYAAWDTDTQQWDVAETFDKGAVCEDCGGPTRLIDVRLPPYGADVAECNSCDWRGDPDDLVTVSDTIPIPDFGERVGDGELMPAGECPECGSCAHLVVGEG